MVGKEVDSPPPPYPDSATATATTTTSTSTSTNNSGSSHTGSNNHSSSSCRIVFPLVLRTVLELLGDAPPYVRVEALSRRALLLDPPDPMDGVYNR